MRNYESEFGTKQSCSYEVRHFYKKLFFNPGIYFDQNPIPKQNSILETSNGNDLPTKLQKFKMCEDLPSASLCNESGVGPKNLGTHQVIDGETVLPRRVSQTGNCSRDSL